MTASPTPTDAVPGDHSPEAGNMVGPTSAKIAQVGLPSEQTIARWLCKSEGHAPDQVDELWSEWLDGARELIDMFRPAFDAKEREIERWQKIAGENAVHAASKRAIAAEAKLAQAVEALEPFASYHEGAEFLDDKGQPLPDEQHAGYVYLTMGDFRRARSASARGETT